MDILSCCLITLLYIQYTIVNHLMRAFTSTVKLAPLIHLKYHAQKQPRKGEIMLMKSADPMKHNKRGEETRIKYCLTYKHHQQSPLSGCNVISGVKNQKKT